MGSGSRFGFKVLAVLLLGGVASSAQVNPSLREPGLLPGSRVLLDAHNAYPEGGRWADRLQRALATGAPLAIEQDLVWRLDPGTGAGRSVVSHGAPLSGDEPSLEEHFFQRVRPLIERALRENRRETWPIVTLNLDFKTNEPEHHRAVWDLLGRYESWLVTARRTASADDIAPLQLAPMLVLTGEADAQQRSFHDEVKPGARLRVFGSYHPRVQPAPFARSNYRRWVNYPWSAVEPEGQPAAGEWTPDDAQRLAGLVDAAHGAGLWIRFYTLDGHNPADESAGWSPGYNFGSLERARTRWRAAIGAGVDFVAVDQYEQFAAVAAALRPSLTMTGRLTRADYETLIEREFDVPPGTERIQVSLTYDDRDRTVIDLGVRGPRAFRGWSGGGPQEVSVATHTASYGYTPGPIEPGRWAVVLGVPNIRDGVNADYRIAIKLSNDGAAPPTVLDSRARWYVGDLHSHSGHSDGRVATAANARLRAPASLVFEAARREGLEFVALTDHNTASHWLDVDRLQPSFPDVLLLHAREITTYRGHFNAFGERRFVDFRLGAGRAVADVARDLGSAGAWLSINHPSSPDDERCMGCGWNDVDETTMRHLHGVEIVNGDGAPDPMAGWRFWADQLNRGLRLVAIGGSDDHTPAEAADRRIGRPATVIFAEELSETGLIAGLAGGRVYVRPGGPSGPALDFTVTSGTETASMGGQVDPGVARLRIQTERAAGYKVEWVRNGRVEESTTLDADGRAGRDTQAAAGDWFSVIVRDGNAAVAMSNAVYVRRPR